MEAAVAVEVPSGSAGFTCSDDLVITRLDEAGIEESIRTIEEKARSEEELEEGRDLLRQAFEKTGQPEGTELLPG